jgi:hypothetical protein
VTSAHGQGQPQAARIFSACHDLFRRTGETVSEFSRPVGDMDLDGVQTAVLHPQAELFVDFLDTVLLEAIAHA